MITFLLPQANSNKFLIFKTKEEGHV
jgi:hypothetical protein